MNQSFFNDLSGDTPLNPKQRLLWLRRNLNLYLDQTEPVFRVRNFVGPVEHYPGPVCARAQSPSRVLSNLFWLSMPKEAIRRELGPLRLLDVGCGKGRYFPILDKIIGPLETYVGVDALRKPDIEAALTDSRASFVLTKAEELDLSLISSCNLIISQSAIEHFRHDLFFFERVATVTRRKSEPTIQIHVLPSSCLGDNTARTDFVATTQ